MSDPVWVFTHTCRAAEPHQAKLSDCARLPLTPTLPVPPPRRLKLRQDREGDGGTHAPNLESPRLLLFNDTLPFQIIVCHAVLPHPNLQPPGQKIRLIRLDPDDTKEQFLN